MIDKGKIRPIVEGQTGQEVANNLKANFNDLADGINANETALGKKLEDGNMATLNGKKLTNGGNINITGEVEEAPTDGALYGRNGKEKKWQKVPTGGGGGGSVEIDTVLDSSSTNNKAAGAKAVVDKLATLDGFKNVEPLTITNDRYGLFFSKVFTYLSIYPTNLDWVVDSHGIQDDGKVTVTFTDSNGLKVITSTIWDLRDKKIRHEEVKNGITFKYELDVEAYLNSFKDLQGFLNPSWKRIFTTKSIDKYALVKDTYSLENYIRSLSTTEYNLLTESTTSAIGEAFKYEPYDGEYPIEYSNQKAWFSVKPFDTDYLLVGFSTEILSVGTTIDVELYNVSLGLENAILIKRFSNLKVSNGKNDIMLPEPIIINNGDICLTNFKDNKFKFREVHESKGFVQKDTEESSLRKSSVDVNIRPIIKNLNRELVKVPFSGTLTKLYNKIERIGSTIYQDIKTNAIVQVDDKLDIQSLESTINNDYDYWCNNLVTKETEGYLNKFIFFSKSKSPAIMEVHLFKVDVEHRSFIKLHTYGPFKVNEGSNEFTIDDSILATDGCGFFLHVIEGDVTFGPNRTNNHPLVLNHGNKLFEGSVVVAFNTYLYKSKKTIYSGSIPNDIHGLNSNLQKTNFHVNEIEYKVSENYNEINYLSNELSHEEYIEVFGDDFSSKKPDWTLGTSWQWDSQEKCMKPTRVGGINSEVVRLNRVYSSDKHILRFKVALYHDTVLNIAGQRTQNNTGEGESFWQVDCKNKKLLMYYAGSEYNYYRGVDTSRVEVSANIPFEIVDGRIYLVEVEKNDFTYYLKLYDTISGKVAIAKNVGWTAGRLQFYYTFSLNSGTPFKIYDLRVSMLNNPIVVFAGDSITEGVYMNSIDTSPTANSLYNRYAEKVRKQIGHCMISAVGGDIIDTIIKKFDSEYDIIKPKYLSIHIGTNGGINTNTEEKFKKVLDKAIAINCYPIINLINCNNSDKYIEINRMILKLSQSEQYKGKFSSCRFDYATSVDNYPWVDEQHPTTIPDKVTRLDTSTMADGACHPNYKGSNLMEVRYHIDTPQIFQG